MPVSFSTGRCTNSASRARPRRVRRATASRSTARGSPTRSNACRPRTSLCRGNQELQRLSARGVGAKPGGARDPGARGRLRTRRSCARTASQPATTGSRMRPSMRLARRRVLVDSYHCSRYNTQTRRLTAAMFESVIGPRALDPRRDDEQRARASAGDRAADGRRRFDAKAFVDALAGAARRVSHARCRGRDALRRQGAQPQEPRRLLFPAEQRPAQGAGAGREDREHGGDDHELRHRGAAARVQSHQEAPAAVQRDPARRQELSVSCIWRRESRLPAARASTAGRARSRAILRARIRRQGRCARRCSSCKSCSGCAIARTRISPTARGHACSTKFSAARRHASA